MLSGWRLFDRRSGRIALVVVRTLFALALIDRVSLLIVPCGIGGGGYSDQKNPHDDNCAVREGVVISGIEWLSERSPETWTAIASIAIAIFTWTLWRSSEKMWRINRLSTTAARQSAYAAEVSARAATKAAETHIGAERAWFLLIIDEENFEAVLESRLHPQSRPPLIKPPDPLVKFHFENFGRSPAFVKEIATEIRNLDALPSRLTYSPNIPWNEEIVVPARGRIPNAKDEEGEWRLFQHRLTSIDEQGARAINRGESHFWFYGRVIYEDIWGNEHVTRFCWGHDGRLDWFLPEGGKRYNERT
jgi:hypothetical protein